MLYGIGDKVAAALLPGQAQSTDHFRGIRQSRTSDAQRWEILNPNRETKSAGVAMMPSDGPTFRRSLLDVKDLTSQGLSAAEDCQLTASLLKLNFGKPTMPHTTTASCSLLPAC